MKKLQQMSTDELGHLVRELLEGFYWLPGLKPNTRYARLHDDHDGELDGFISVTIGKDGDAWVDPINDTGSGLRFRMPLHGGGASPRVRTALMILAEAIRLDNEELPMQSAADVLERNKVAMGGVAARLGLANPLDSVRWVCKACNTSNDVGIAVCVGCKKPRPEEKPA